ncbi:hypothetical protein ABIE56_004530, partial [Luteibacter sp. 621]
NHLEKMFHEGVDRNEKRSRMGGSLRTKCLEAENEMFPLSD